MKRGAEGLFLAVLLTSSVGCEQSVPNIDRPAENVQSPQGASPAIPAATIIAPAHPAAIAASRALPPAAPPIAVRADAMTDLAPAHMLPVSVSVRAPVTVTRTSQGEWLVRATVRIVNDAPTPAMAERALLVATVGGTPLVLDSGEQGLDGEIPLASGQAANGAIVWRVPAGIASPTHVTIAYGLPSARVSADVLAE